jgi:uncharacterized protein YigE (DUF2233 family)
MNRIRVWLAITVASFTGSGSLAADTSFTVVRVDTRTERLELFLNDEQGKPFHRLEKLALWLSRQNKKLRFGMNAGMYEPDFTPVGLFVVNGTELAPLNLANASGNFYLKPNGVFYLTAAGPAVVESSKFNVATTDLLLATQSGPMLVEHGAIHPAFQPQSKSKLIRNGVGVSGTDALFVISNEPVSLYELAVHFRDVLGCRDALYFDGVVSALYLPDAGRRDSRTNLGPLIGVIE